MLPTSPDRSALILARFNAAHSLLASRLRDLPAEAAELRPDIDAWSPAQVGWHVALTDEWIAGVLTGETPMAEPAPAGFRETLHTRQLPARVKTFPALEPPAAVTRDAALERLRASGQRASKAIASLTPARGAGYCVALPFGTLSLFELADFASGHVTRHVAQIERAVART